MKALFRRFAERVALIVGTPWAFIVALTIIGVWGVSGPLFSFSTHWQLVVNSFTTIGTFLMVFIIQNTQNRDFKAIQIKLDALLHASPATPPGLVNLHNLSDPALLRLEQAFESLGGQQNVDEIVHTLTQSGRENKPD
ncbi:MAG TPA: low affinity iron permease family protein [Gemmatimonadaceae bacterium]|nr:low affinity iron permease family protein [Gemmatimonadaceae bacterium]